VGVALRAAQHSPPIYPTTISSLVRHDAAAYPAFAIRRGVVAGVCGGGGDAARPGPDRAASVTAGKADGIIRQATGDPRRPVAPGPTDGRDPWHGDPR